MTCGERNRQIIALYQSGVPKKEIVGRMGISLYSLNKILDAWTRYGDRVFEGQKTVYRHVKAQAEDIKRLRVEGHTWAEIVEITGVSRSSVYRLLLDERDMTADVMWQKEALAYKESEVAKREQVEIGDTVRFWSRGREVVAVVDGKQAYTVRCTETLQNGVIMTYSPQYQDIEVIRRVHVPEEIHKRGN